LYTSIGYAGNFDVYFTCKFDIEKSKYQDFKDFVGRHGEQLKLRTPEEVKGSSDVVVTLDGSYRAKQADLLDAADLIEFFTTGNFFTTLRLYGQASSAVSDNFEVSEEINNPYIKKFTLIYPQIMHLDKPHMDMKAIRESKDYFIINFKSNNDGKYADRMKDNKITFGYLENNVDIKYEDSINKLGSFAGKCGFMSSAKIAPATGGVTDPKKRQEEGARANPNNRNEEEARD
jgi:hypothetical protein